METTPRLRIAASLTFASAALVLSSCTGSSGNSAPQITTIPAQSVQGGATLSLDLAQYVTDREKATLTYSVTSGGGGFSGSSYSHMFDTLGSYTVNFSVTDGARTNTGTFDCKVTSANLAVVQEDTDGLALLDTDTRKFLPLTNNAATPTLATTLAQGQLVWQETVGGKKRLHVFDAAARTYTRLGAFAAGDVTYLAKTGTNVVFTAVPSSDTDLYVYDTTTSLTQAISALVGEAEGGVQTNAAGLVYYERGAGGQADVWAFDTATATSTAVSTDARDERIKAVMPDGGVVFSRIGAGGETDLFYYRQDSGTAEIGVDVTAIAGLDKTFNDHGTASQVVFTVTNGAARDIYWWNPLTGTTSTVATGAVHRVNDITASNGILYTTEVSTTDWDISVFRMTNNTTSAINSAATKSEFQAVTSNGTVAYVIYLESGTPNKIYLTDADSATNVSFTSSTNVQYDGLLGGTALVFSHADGSSIFSWTLGAGAPVTVATATSLAFGGAAKDAGDFVYSLSVSGQTDLTMWDASGTANVTVSNTTGNDAFAGLAANGDVLFTRVDADSFKQLFVWRPTDVTTAQLTTQDTAGAKHDHAVLGTYSASNN